MAAVIILLAAIAWGCGSQDPSDSSAHDPLQADGELLEALGYVEWSDRLDEHSRLFSGVVRHDVDRCQPGLNFYTGTNGRAFLIDASGEVVHQWTTKTEVEWKVARLLPGGELLVLSKDGAILRLGWDSEVVWSRDLKAHHDLALDTDGNIYVLTGGGVFSKKKGPGIYPVRLQGVTVVSSKGDVLRSFSLNALFPEADPEPTAEAIEAYVRENPVRRKGRSSRIVLDTIHSNSLTALPRDVPGLGDKGDILLSMRRTNTLAVVDAAGQRVKWRWGPGELLAQHHPNLLDNDCLLIFDNGDQSRPWSRIVEYCPGEGRIVWEYRGTELEPFFSSSRGSVQRLDNDNVLVTDSASGRVFEVDRGGEIVWEWFNPEQRKSGDDVMRRAIYRMTRIAGDLLDSLPLVE